MNEKRWGWLFVLPALSGIFVFTLLPALGSLWLSLTQWDLLGTPNWVGLGNYLDLLGDPLFYQVMAQTGVFVVLYVALDLVLACGLALALSQPLKGLAIFRTLYFLPVVTAMVAAAILWNWVFDVRFGVLNAFLGGFGIDPVQWLIDPRWALPSLVVVTLWKYLGYDMLLLLAGLQAVPKEQLEAASLDGAAVWQRFWHVTRPLLMPSLILVTVLATIRAFQTFDAVYLLTEGGPQRSTTIAGYWLFQNAFSFFKLGKASALAFVVFVMVMGLTWVQWRVYRRMGHQEENA